DPSGNRIAQWRDVTPQQGIMDLSLPLSAEPALGTYAIEEQGTRHSFSVEEYGAGQVRSDPRAAPVVAVLDEMILLRVCGRIQLREDRPGEGPGQPVLGETTIISQVQFLSGANLVHRAHWPGTESNGCFSREVGTAPFNLTHSGYKRSLQAKASLMEEGTGVELNTTKHCDIMSEIATVTFEDADTTYKAGIPYTGKVTGLPV
ncbi:unnamed protein product, partial [Natator depressus]